jgi:hypothetical protein
MAIPLDDGLDPMRFSSLADKKPIDRYHASPEAHLTFHVYQEEPAGDDGVRGKGTWPLVTLHHL